MSAREAICMMWVNGRETSPDLLRSILSLEFVYSQKKATSGTLVLRDEDFSIFDARIFRKGQALHFFLGWVNEALPTGPFIVKSYSTSAPASGNPVLTVKFQDPSHKMNAKQKQRRHTGRPTEILKKIAKEHGLGYSVSTIDGLEFTDDFPLVQASMSDAALIQRLADRYGYVWGVDGGTLYFQLPAERQNRKKLSPPVLSYRINDQSLMSFSPEIKYSSGRKRKGAKDKVSNIDLFGGKSLGEMVTESLGVGLSEDEKKRLFAENPHDDKDALIIEETIAKGTEKVFGKDAKTFYHEAVDSGERLVSWLVGAGYQTNAEYFQSLESVERGRKIAKPVETATEADVAGEGEEYQQGDPSGSATPNTEDEANRRSLAKKSRAAEIITGEAVPTIGSMLFTPGAKITLLGVGQFLSGDYLIKEVRQRFGTGAATFNTSLRVYRSKFLPGAAAKSAALEVEQKVQNGLMPAQQLGGSQDLSTIGGGGPIREIEAALSSYQEGGPFSSTLVDWEEEI